MIAQNITELIGKTPLLDISSLAHDKGADKSTKLLAKLEYFNPSSSVKDRAALGIIRAAEKSGALKPGGTLIEASSGNTGIGLAALSAALGYKMVVTMPETMSVERRRLIEQLGAELVLTPGDKGMKGAIAEAERLEQEGKGVLARQFDNKANPLMHEKTTGPEIWEDTKGEVDVFVAGVGTGGTISGAGRFLRSKNSEIELIAVEPATSAVMSGEAPGKHGIQGIGAGFIPENMDMELINTVERVETEEAVAASQEFTKRTGALVGISSGASLHAALKLAQQEEYKGKTIVVLLPDTAERYLSTPLFG